ncbi:TonB-dependent siderophore receptor [Nitrospira sp. KM1]|uniref:TonB-dependent siderophore receptor n=1 Tax=Nitrospira sp. KM1 TaxID=1936990 RepID=UPI0013A778B3|nr:TonB-dependent receptor [Nitrospira sp. KM1]BCA57167.1 TonB-dependent siderophore receptor [Nitrospira sp. KM1]
MRHIKLKRRFPKANRHPETVHLQSAYQKVAEACHGCRPQSLAWGIMVGLSSMALSAHNPALAQDWRGDQPTSQDGSPSRNHAGARLLNGSSRSLGGDQQPQRSLPGLRLAAQQDVQGGPKQPFDIPAGNLQSALQAFSKQVDLQIFYTSDVVAGVQTQGVKGVYTPQEALATLLTGTGLGYRFIDANTVMLQRAGNSEATQTSTGKPVLVPEILVKDVKERPVVDAPDGYMAEVSSEAVLRFPAEIQELPQSISVVTRDSMRERRAVTQNEALEGVAGFTKASQSSFNNDDYVLRGFSTSPNTPGFIRDNGLAAFNNYIADPNLYERIEVIKGAASFTSGLVAAGGFVNRLLKAPLNENFVVAEAGGTSYGGYRTTLDANGTIPTIPQLAGRFVFVQNQDPQFFNNTGNQRFSFLPSVRLATDNGFTVTATGNIQHLTGKGNYGTPTNIFGQIPAGIKDSLLGPDNKLKQNYQSAHIEAEKKFAQGFRLRAKGQYSHDEINHSYVYGYQYTGGIGPNGNFGIYANAATSRRESWAGEVNLIKDFSLLGNMSSVAAGMDYSLGNQTRQRPGFVFLGTGNIANPEVNLPFPPDYPNNAVAASSNNLRFQQTGAYLQGLLRPFAGTTVMAALRGNWITQTSFNQDGTHDGLNVSRLTPQIGLSQRLVEGLNLYASYGESIQPNFAVTADGSLLDPITGQTVEIGSKWEPLGKRLMVTAAVFRTLLDNVATPDPAFPPNSGFSIGGQSQRNQGFEFEARGALLPQLQVNLAYTYLDTKITESLIPGVVGANALNAPHHTVSAFGSYDFTELFAKGLKLGAVVYYRSQVNSFVPFQNQTYEGYTRADLFAIYAPLEWLSLQLNFNNIANAGYVEGPNRYAGFNQFGAPRHVIGMVRMTF